MKRSIILLLVAASMLQPTDAVAAKGKKGRAEESVAPLIAQDTIKSVDYSTQVFNSFFDFYNMGIDEKLYLQTDKPYYSGGEKIWFKGYLLNAITHAPLNNSNFIYVELRNSESGLISRVKIKRDNMGFNGHIEIDPKADAGEYTLTAYTRWMTNKDEGYFFSKNIHIVSPIPDSSSTEEQEAMSQRRARKAEEEAKQRSEEAAEAMKSLDFDLQFFPEGGDLLPNIHQKIAFKAIASDGGSIEISGKIFNNADEYIGDIKSVHKGMDTISLSANVGEQFYTIVTSSGDVEKRFNLPLPVEKGVAIMVSHVDKRVYYQIQTTDPQLLEGAHIVIHSRGRIITTASVAGAAVSYINDDQLYDGVSVFSLVDAENNVMSERLIFIKPSATPQITFESGAENYAKRAKVDYKVRVTDSEGAPLKGDFAVSVTDSSSIKIDKNQNNALSYLLLSSEIKGNVEDPGYYFSEDTPKMLGLLDMMMMTQGWSRFKLEDILKSQVKRPSIKYENSGIISGEIKGFFGNAARSPKLYVLCPKLNLMDVMDLNESHRFNLVDLDIPDSTTYIIQTRGKNGGNAMTLKIVPESFPVITPTPLFMRGVAAEKEIPAAFLNQSIDKFYYDGGMQMINFEAISVTTEVVVDNGLNGITSSKKITREELDARKGMLLSIYISTYPGMSISESEEGDMAAYYRGNNTPVRFMVNGFDDEYSNIEMMTTDDVEQIDFFTDAEAAIFSDSSGGVFNITLREGASTGGNVQPLGIAHVNQLGYQNKVEFYQPKYDDASVKRTSPPDFRTTIFWSGELQSDENGEFSFNFFTADKPTTYTILVEGVSEFGVICHGETTLERTLAN